MTNYYSELLNIIPTLFAILVYIYEVVHCKYIETRLLSNGIQNP